jgi:hypothetical protein
MSLEERPLRFGVGALMVGGNNRVMVRRSPDDSQLSIFFTNRRRRMIPSERQPAVSLPVLKFMPDSEILVDRNLSRLMLGRDLGWEWVE